MLHHLGRRTPLFPLCAVALLLCIGSAAAQFRQRVDPVTIDVSVVNGRGEPVTDLSSEDAATGEVVVMLTTARTGASGAQPAAIQDDQQVSVAGLLAQLGEYVRKFEREFSAVAEERYVQLIRPLEGPPSWPPHERALEWHDGSEYPRTGLVVDRRQLRSDVLLVQTSQGWIGYRDVAEVDGRTVGRRRDRVEQLFLSRGRDRDDQLRRVAEESARYNIGGFRRTVNIPTLPLYFMQARNHSRFTFRIAGREQLGDRSPYVVSYEEHERPTLIGSRAGDDVPIAGRLWIDAGTAEVVQTEIRFVSGEGRASRRGTLVTRYRQDPRFTVLVPDYMWEWYDGGVANLDVGISATSDVFGSVSKRTVVEGLARYTNYRKFSVSTSEIPR
ncbi:MAG TPA: hypothetical protein VFZ21_03490 [Gemmatimonadaceae bacterium]|nr:hypothetical protein [Gemmatimonadaceae bacterium]